MREDADRIVDEREPQPPATEPHTRPRVIIADDHPHMRCAMARMLSADCEVVGEAADGASVLELLSHIRSHAVVMDIQMPIMNGLVACSLIRREFPDIPVVIVTSHMDEGIQEVAREAGAASFVDKHRLALDLGPAVRAALNTVSRAANGSPQP